MPDQGRYFCVFLFEVPKYLRLKHIAIFVFVFGCRKVIPGTNRKEETWNLVGLMPAAQANIFLRIRLLTGKKEIISSKIRFEGSVG